MIIKEINKRIVAIVTLCLFLLSTNGMVLFYHYCQHGTTLVYSMFVDATSDRCQKGNADAEFHTHHPEVDCCAYDYNTQDNKNSCNEHKTATKTLKLKNDYNFSDRQVTPKPMWLKLWISDILLNTNSPDCTHILAEGWRDIPFEKPICQRSGKQILTLYQTFKIAC